MQIPAVEQLLPKSNIRVFESIYLLHVHLFGLIGLTYALFNADKLLPILAIHGCFWVMYCIGITAGSHRLWAHKSYSASTPLKVLLMLWSSGAHQGSIFHWSRDHRLHHKFSDTELDPHSISRGFFFSHIGWLLVKKNPKLVVQGRKINLEDLLQDNVVMFQKRHYHLLSILMCFIVPSLAYWLIAGVPVAAALFLSMFTYMWNLNATWCVNSICHMFGTRPWNQRIEPRDNYFVSLLTHGEGYHNWHHEFPGDWRASKDDWYMINISARFIELMSALGLAKIKA